MIKLYLKSTLTDIHANTLTMTQFSFLSHHQPKMHETWLGSRHLLSVHWKFLRLNVKFLKGKNFTNIFPIPVKKHNENYERVAYKQVKQVQLVTGGKNMANKWKWNWKDSKRLWELRAAGGERKLLICFARQESLLLCGST